MYYIKIKDYDSYDEINKIAKNYYSSIMRDLLLDDLERRNEMFIANDLFIFGVETRNNISQKIL